MKNSKTKAGNIFASIKEEEQKEQAAKPENNTKNKKNQPESQVDTSIKSKNQVDSAIKKPETMAKTTASVQSAKETAPEPNTSKIDSNNPGVNYLNDAKNNVEPPVNNGLLYIVPTKKKTRSHRKGFLLSDLALNNLQKEAAKYEISENELINQILEKMI